MMRAIIRSSMKSRLVVVAVAAALMILGLGRLRQMPLDALPEFSPPYVEIQTESLGLSAEEVEQLITVPMEQDLLNGVPWLQTIRSESVPGLSSVVLVFQPGTDLMRARQMVSERMTQAVALPHVSKPPTMLQPLSATSRVLIAGLSSKSLTPIQMSVLAQWTIAPRLMGVPGVANVAIWGQRDRQLQVQVDPKKLAANGISLTKVLETTGNALWVSSLSFVEASTPGTGGFIDTDNQRLGIRHILPIVSSEGLAQVPLEGTRQRLSDVANVVEDHQPLIGDALTRDGAGILLVIEKFPGANTLEVTRGVEEAFSELKPGLPGLDIDSNLFRPADFIESAVHNVRLVALLGFLLMALAIAAFFFEWRATLIGVVTVPLVLTAAAIVLGMTGATMNAIALTGFMMAIGVVVSHTVFDVDHMMQRLRTAGGHSPARTMLDAFVESRSGLLYAVLVVLLAVAPILFIEGSSGSFFRPMAIAYALAVLASLLVALTITPALSMILLARSRGRQERAGLTAGLQNVYESMLKGLVGKAPLAYGLVIVLTLVGVVLAPRLSRSLLPLFKERNMLIELTCVPGTAQPEMSRVAARVCEELRTVAGIKNVGAHIGRAIRGDQVVNVNSASVWVTMDPAANYDQTAAAIENVVEGYPGVKHTVKTYLREKSSDVVPDREDNVIVRVYGDEDGVLRQQGEDVRKAITGIRGVAETRIHWPIRQATLETEVNIAKAQAYGLKPGDVRRAAATLLSGIQVGSLFEDQKVFDVVVWSTPETRHSMSNIRDMMIDTPSGGHVRLGDIADVRIVPTASVIRHEAVKRYVDVVAAVEGRDHVAVAADIDKAVHAIPFALESHARVFGSTGLPEVVHAHLWMFGLGAAIGIFFLLQALLGSWRLAGLALFTLPAGLAGGLLVAVASGNVLSLGALGGLLAVFGLVATNTIMLMRRYQQLEHDGERFGPALAVRGAREHLPALLVSSVATAAALLPVLFMGDVPGLEIARPMLLVILGGLVTTLLLAMVCMPALFLSLGVSSVREADPFAVREGAPDRTFGGLSGAPAVMKD